jgi:hypothetical protein
MRNQNTAVEGRAQPTGSAPEDSADAVADTVESLGKMAGVDDPQPADLADEADDGTQAEAEGEPEAAEAEGEQAADESGDDVAEGDEADGKQDHRSPRAERRISELTAEKKQAEAKVLAAETRAKELETIAAEGVGLHPDYVSEAEAKLISRATQLQAREKELLRNWDGIEDDDPTKARNAQQVRTEWSDVRSELDDLGPRARRIYDDKLAQMVADMKEGRRLRLERGSAIKRGAPAADPKKGVRPAPAAAVPKGSAGTPGVTKPRAATAPNEDRFLKGGANRQAAERELSMLVGAD